MAKRCECGVCARTFRSILARRRHKQEVHGGYFHNMTPRIRFKRIMEKADEAVSDMKDETLKLPAYKIIMEHLIEGKEVNYDTNKS